MFSPERCFSPRVGKYGTACLTRLQQTTTRKDRGEKLDYGLCTYSGNVQTESERRSCQQGERNERTIKETNTVRGKRNNATECSVYANLKISVPGIFLSIAFDIAPPIILGVKVGGKSEQELYAVKSGSTNLLVPCTTCTLGRHENSQNKRDKGKECGAERSAAGSSISRWITENPAHVHHRAVRRS